MTYPDSITSALRVAGSDADACEPQAQPSLNACDESVESRKDKSGELIGECYLVAFLALDAA